MSIAYVEIPLTQGKVAFVDVDDYESVSQFKWRALRAPGKFYAIRSLPRPPRGRTQALHAFLTGYPLTDHINGDGLDNRRANLREATGVQNGQNRGRQANNASGFKGVRRKPGRYTWEAYIVADGGQRFLGSFTAAEDAARAYDAAAREHFGEFARLNFPRVGERSALPVVT